MAVTRANYGKLRAAAGGVPDRRRRRDRRLGRDASDVTFRSPVKTKSYGSTRTINDSMLVSRRRRKIEAAAAATLFRYRLVLKGGWVRTKECGRDTCGADVGRGVRRREWRRLQPTSSPATGNIRCLNDDQIRGRSSESSILDRFIYNFEVSHQRDCTEPCLLSYDTATCWTLVWWQTGMVHRCARVPQEEASRRAGRSLLCVLWRGPTTPTSGPQLPTALKLRISTMAMPASWSSAAAAAHGCPRGGGG